VSLFKSSDFHHEAEKPQDLHELFLNLVEILHFYLDITVHPSLG